MTPENIVSELESIVADSCGEKNGIYLVETCERYLRGLLPSWRPQVVLATRTWLTSLDPGRAHWAIGLSVELGLHENLPLLDSMLARVRARDPWPPIYLDQFLLPAIDSLRKAAGPVT